MSDFTTNPLQSVMFWGPFLQPVCKRGWSSDGDVFFSDICVPFQTFRHHNPDGVLESWCMRQEDRQYLTKQRRQADRLVHEGDIGQAISVHFGIIRSFRDNPSVCEKAYADVADLHLIMLELDLAIGYFQTALSFSPAKPHLHYLLGFAFALGYHWDKAITEFRFALSQDPDRFEYAYALGWCLYESGHRSKAIELLKKTGRLHSDPAEIADLTATLFLHEDKAGIMCYARLAVKVSPGSPEFDHAYYALQELDTIAKSITNRQNLN